MANLRPNDEIDKVGIRSMAANDNYRKGYPSIKGFGQTKMEKKLERQGEKND